MTDILQKILQAEQQAEELIKNAKTKSQEILSKKQIELENVIKQESQLTDDEIKPILEKIKKEKERLKLEFKNKFLEYKSKLSKIPESKINELAGDIVETIIIGEN